MTIFKKIVLIFVTTYILFLLLFSANLYFSFFKEGKNTQFKKDFGILFAITGEYLDTKSEVEREEIYKNSKSQLFSLKEVNSSEYEFCPFNEYQIFSKKNPKKSYILTLERVPIFKVLFTILGLFVFLLIIMSFFLRLTLKPISEMVTAVDSISRGDYSTRINHQKYSKDFYNLGEGFNQMVEKLEIRKQRDQLLLRSISHELRSPITSLIFLFEIMKEQKRYDRFEELGKGLQLIQNTLNDIDLIATSILKNRSIRVYKFDLLTWINEFIKDTESFVEFSKKKYEFHYPETSTEIIVTGNESYLRIIMKNLIDNFLHYDLTNPKISIELELEQENTVIKLPVAEKIELSSEELFTPFVRAKDSSVKYPEGKGLGLTICKALSEMLGWSILYKEQAFQIRI